MAKPTYTPHIRQIRTLYAETNAITRKTGGAWYQTEHAEIEILAKRTGHEPEIIAACLAVLSPRCQWPRVKAACEAFLSGATPAGIFRHNLEKARLILAARNAIPIDPLRAPKTWAFWQNLWRPNDPEPVTLDSWMFRAHGLHIKAGLTTYRSLAEAYRRAAGDLGLIPNQLQATIWLRVKGRHAP